MGMRLSAARAISAVSTWGLKNVFHRPAANFPGKVALYLDPQLIGDLRSRMREGSMIIVGTNGKTTVTNTIADVLEAAGKQVICNRTGANLDSGIATSLLQSQEADWGVFECDELWLAKSLPGMQATYVILLNLFRDQLDRIGEVDRIQESIVGALKQSPETTLIYNADDPTLQAIADKVDNPKIAFGIGEAMNLQQDDTFDAQVCQSCSALLDYEYRQYDQLGAYNCKTCGFKRAELDYAAKNIAFVNGGIAFDLAGKAFEDTGQEPLKVCIPIPVTYLIYNMTAVVIAARLVGVDADVCQQTLDGFNPKNGRLERYEIDGRPILINLAKNPTGFNQNVRVITAGTGSKVAAFYVNDAEGDGRDVSWLWDIDFEALASEPDIRVYVGGVRRNDLQVRFKYTGIDAKLVEGARDVLADAAVQAPDATAYFIANYTSLPDVKAELDALVAERAQGAQKASQGDCKSPFGRQKAYTEIPTDAVVEPEAQATTSAIGAGADTSAGDADATAHAPIAVDAAQREPLVIVQVYPELLNLYGVGGNVTILVKRLQARGIPVEVERVELGEPIDFSRADIVFMGGGPDREQKLACDGLLPLADELRAYVEDDGVVLAICGGYQLLGKTWLLGDEELPGLAVVDISTRRPEGESYNRLLGNIALNSPLAKMPVIGYEIHAGRTYLGDGCAAFGRVIGNNGKGNNDHDKADGVLYRNVVGTYLHGPLLAKNPEVADALIRKALERKARKCGAEVIELAALDDAVEKAANKVMCERLGIR